MEQVRKQAQTDWLGRELDQGVMRCGLKWDEWKIKMLLGEYNASFKCLLGKIFINGRRECFGNIQPNSASMRHVFDLGLCRYVSPTSADTLLLSSAHCVSPFRPRKLFSYRLVQIRLSHCHKVVLETQNAVKPSGSTVDPDCLIA